MFSYDEMLHCFIDTHGAGKVLYSSIFSLLLLGRIWGQNIVVNPEIFARDFIFANSVKRHICDVKNLRLGHDLPISVNERVIVPFREDFIFKKLRLCEVSRKITPSQKFPNLQ